MEAVLHGTAMKAVLQRTAMEAVLKNTSLLHQILLKEWTRSRK